MTQFDTTPYRNSHGKEPKGFGRWAFSLTRNASPEEIFCTEPCTFTEAKKIAKYEFCNPISLYIRP